VQNFPNFFIVLHCPFWNLFWKKNKIKWMNLIYLPIFSRLPFILLFIRELMFVSNFLRFSEWSTWTCFLLDMLF
jgi:hypothetical protein